MMLTVNRHVRYKGWFRLYTTNECGEVTQDTGFFPNLITNGGLDFVGSCPTVNVAYGASDFTAMVAIGIGNAAPAYTDVTLQSWLAALVDFSGHGCNTNTSYNAGPPAYWQGQRSWQFAAGTATGNVAEIGVGPSSHASPVATDPLFSRALVVDGSGHPTVIPVLATEALTVTYVLQMYLDLSDTSYTMSLSGTTYSGVFRRAQVSTVGGLGLGPSYNVGNLRFVAQTYNGSIQGVTQSPTGTTSFVAATPATYTNGTYYMGFSCTYDVNSGNYSGGITAIMWTNYAFGNWQMSVSPFIPKTTSYAMTLNCNLSWARYP